MYPVPVSDRMEAYTTKMKAGTDYVAPVTASKLALMIRKMRAVACRQVAYLARVKVVLSQEGVTMIQAPFYIAFAHEVALVAERTSGEAAAEECETLIGKWSTRELSPDVLKRIRSGVFNISDPA